MEYTEPRKHLGGFAMLLQFSVTNHRSIRDTAVISMKASTDKSLSDSLISPDEKSGAEKKTAAQMLAQATTLKEAIAVLEDGMKGTLADYTIASVTETQLMDVFPFDANSIPGEKKSGEELIAEQKQQAEQRG